MDPEALERAAQRNLGAAFQAAYGPSWPALEKVIREVLGVPTITYRSVIRSQPDADAEFLRSLGIKAEA